MPDTPLRDAKIHPLFALAAPVLFLALLAALPAFAVTVQTSQQGGAPFVTGGFGVDERNAMVQALPDYNLKVEFAEGGRPYVAGAQIQVEGHGVAINTMVDGPWLLARLPAGSYALTASLDGVAKRQSVRVGGGVSRVVFRW